MQEPSESTVLSAAEWQWLGAVLLVAFVGLLVLTLWRRWLRPAPRPLGRQTPQYRSPLTARQITTRRSVLRVLAFANAVLGFIYLSWRWTASLNLAVWPLAIALVVAETYSYIGALLFGLTVWREKHRANPPAPVEGSAVDVFITCYNEPVELVRRTVQAANAIRYPHRTHVLDDGDSTQMREMAAAEGATYIVRSLDWSGRARHAKAGNLNNALLATTGEFILMLDADQIPTPGILDRTLGYFRNPRLAFVQTDQPFYNIPPGDPFGSDASLFYGPIQQGKDGWNAAFFCGSNAVLRREALMQLGVTRYVVELERRVRRALGTSSFVLDRADRQLAADDTVPHGAIAELRQIIREASDGLRKRQPIQDVTWIFQRRAEEVARRMVASDLTQIRAQLASISGADGVDLESSLADALDDEATLHQLTSREASPLAAIEEVRGLLMAVDLDRGDEAQPVMPLSTISVTEDMATAMRLHALGWQSVFQHEALASGLAPEDLRSALQQRLRWAQGTIQVLLRENPLFVKGLSIGQRLMYFSTMWSYLAGPFTLVYLLAPPLYLFFGWLPITAYSAQFFARIIPYLIVNQLLFTAVGWGLNTFRGQQNSLAMFPLWIQALYTAVANVYFGKPLGFVVTPKTRQARGALVSRLTLVRVQVAAMVVLTAAALWGLLRLTLGLATDYVAILVNVSWIVYDLVMLSAVLDAVAFEPTGSGQPVEEDTSADDTAAAAHGRVLASPR
jgi:cellulose synthase (UDP-forming)